MELLELAEDARDASRRWMRDATARRSVLGRERREVVPGAVPGECVCSMGVPVQSGLG